MIKFNKPDEEAKEHIWKIMMPDLSQKEVRELAVDYDFSGGQIEKCDTPCTRIGY